MIPHPLPHMPDSLGTPDEIIEAITLLSGSYTICPGNGDPQFIALATSRGGNFYAKASKYNKSSFIIQWYLASTYTFADDAVVAYLDEMILPHPTVRHSKCKLLISEKGGRCSLCSQHRCSLRAMISQQKAARNIDRADPSSHVNYRFLSDEEPRMRLQQLQSKVRAESKKVERLRKNWMKSPNLMATNLTIKWIGIFVTS